ncbi:MAG: NADPH-dependent glutamate synthase [Oscillospiraceae bacterium]|nr:NADPH-dependent glutamate synthase [Oscillospiraceae bacterium]
MPEQKPEIRAANFLEVSTGYTAEMAISEAMRCLKCRDKPCTRGCPVNVRIPEFIAKVAAGEFEEAYKIITCTNALPAVCGRVCPQESQCESKCVRGEKGQPVAIGRLERFVADYHAKYGTDAALDVAPNGKKVAVVGAGPAGLACAGDLANKGYDVTVYESLHKPGGVLIYGIPEFRLPKTIVEKEVSSLKAKGVKFINNVVIGRSITIDELKKEEGFDAVFVGTGAGLPRFMGIPGENYLEVCSANEYLTRINLMKAYLDDYDTPVILPKKVAVVGAGNVAMDAARCARRMGAEVTIVYRRSEAEIPARAEEIHHAKEEGIVFKLLTNPVQILGNAEGHVTGMECISMELTEPDASGRRGVKAIEGSNFVLDVDGVIMALGTMLNRLILETTDGLEANSRGGIGTDEKAATNVHGVYAGGDAVTGAATVIKAMGAGKTAAAGIDELLSK